MCNLIYAFKKIYLLSSKLDFVDRFKVLSGLRMLLEISHVLISSLEPKASGFFSPIFFLLSACTMKLFLEIDFLI
jgi:hypothetical protein